MSHFAEIDENGIVKQVIVAEQEVIDSGKLGDPKNWIQTSYNTKGGVHYGPDNNPDGGIPFRKNYAGIGYKYDKDRDAFIPPQPFKSWILDEKKCQWEVPKKRPADAHEKDYRWNEDKLTWEEI